MSRIEYSVRTMREGDEDKLAAFSSWFCERSVGFVPRTAQYWKHAYATRPGVIPGGIFLVETSDSREIVGSAVVSSSGQVYEFCVDPHADQARVVALLLPEIEQYAKGKGAEYILIPTPPGKDCSQKQFIKSGYSQFARQYIVGIVLNFPDFIKHTLKATASLQPTTLRGTFLIRLSKDGKRYRSPAFSDGLCVFFEDGKGYVEENTQTRQADVTIEMDVFTFTDILLRLRGLSRLALERKIKIIPFWQFSRAFQLLSLLRIPYPWYTPLGDLV